jgi:hypothetical protein
VRPADGRQGTPQHASPHKRQAADPPPPAFAEALRHPLRSRRSCEDIHDAASLVQVRHFPPVMQTPHAFTAL